MTIRSLAIAIPAVLAGWITVLITVSLVSDAAPAQVVLFPSQDLMRNLPEDSSLIGGNSWSVTLASTSPGFARSLYANGAWIVLPAGLPGCLPMPG